MISVIKAFKKEYIRPRIEPKSQYDCMLQIDCTFVGLKKNVVVLCGSSRTGKSTLSNIIAAKPLIGKDNDYGQIVYVGMSGDGLFTQGYLVSCTTVCNRMDFDETSIIDLSGFMDQRSEKQLLAVIYNIKKLFENGHNVKFMLTISDNESKAELAKDKFRPYYNFLNLFKNVLNIQELKQKIYSASFIMFTKTYKPLQSYKKLLNGTSKALQNEAIKIQMKNQIKQFLDFIIKEEKFDIFPVAKEGISPEPINIQKSNWNYLNLVQEKSKYGKFWNEDFDGMFKKMNLEQQKSFKQNIITRVNSFKSASTILSSIIRVSSTNNSWYNDKIDYHQVTQLLQKFSQQFDYYTTPNLEYAQALTEQFAAADQNDNVQQKTGLQLIKILKDTYYDTMKLSQITTLVEKKQIYQQLFQNIKKIFQNFKHIYCTNSAQEKYFLDFSFSYLRGILEFSQLQEIDTSITSDCLVTITESFADIFSQNIIALQYQFIQNMPEDVRKKLFDTHKKRFQFKLYVQNFCKDLSNQNLSLVEFKNIDQKKLKYTQILNEMSAADDLIKDQKKKEALQGLLGVIEKIYSYIQTLKQGIKENPSQQSLNHMKEMQMILVQALKKIAYGISKTKNQDLAIKLFQFIDHPLSVIECKKIAISETLDQNLIFQYQIKLGNYCLSVGKKETAIDSYYAALQSATKVQQRYKALKKLEEVDKITKNQLIEKTINKRIEPPNDKLIKQIQQYVQKLVITSNKSSISGSVSMK